MFTLRPDVYLTRRQRLHFILDSKDELKWSGKTIAGALTYLVAQGENQFRVVSENADGPFICVVQDE